MELEVPAGIRKCPSMPINDWKISEQLIPKRILRLGVDRPLVERYIMVHMVDEERNEIVAVVNPTYRTTLLFMMRKSKWYFAVSDLLLY